MADTKSQLRNPKVWAIARFVERFEMDDYRRKGALDYVRMFGRPRPDHPGGGSAAVAEGIGHGGLTIASHGSRATEHKWQKVNRR